MHRNYLEVQSGIGRSALHDHLHQIAVEDLGTSQSGTRLDQEASTEGLGMHRQHCNIHSLRWLRVPTKSVRGTGINQALHMLLPKHSADELAKRAQEMRE